MKKYLLWIALIAVVFISTAMMTEVDSKPKEEAKAQSMGNIKEEAKEKPKEDAKAIDFTLKDVNGKSVKLSQYRGKLVVVDIFATWCGYCMDEIPELIKMQEQYTKDKKPVQLIGVGVDQNVDDIKELAKNNKFSYPVLIGDNETVTSVFGDVQYLPTKFIISSEGKILKRLTGGMPNDTLKKIIESYMPKVKPKKDTPAKVK